MENSTTNTQTQTPTSEAVQRINSNLEQIFTPEQQDELYLAEMELHFRMIHESAIPEWVSEIYG